MPDTFAIAGGFAVENKSFEDAEIKFRAKAPLGTEQVQIWGGFRYRDRDSRYVFALRGGNDNDVYLARYAPDGNARFLGYAPLDFKPVPGVWYQLRIVTLGNQIQIYLNDEKIPRLNVTDRDALWDEGKVFVGGGWLPAEFADLQIRPLTSGDKQAFQSIGDLRWAAPAVDKEALRKSQRAEYIPSTLPNWNPLRTEILLDGNWLFLPDYQMPVDQTPTQLNYDDRGWHIMPVPSFWTPGLSWLHGETGFANLDEFSATKGVADSLFVQEIRRCNAYTFDWQKTGGAWYRQYINLPGGVGDRHVELTFDAIAKISTIWVNGIEVGTHTGMFGDIKCDVTKAVKTGKNVIAVHVISKPQSSKDASNAVKGVAVSVEVTAAMLNSLPHGMLQDNVGGIWQPVKLTATASVLVSDCFVQPGLQGADINLDILNTRKRPANFTIDYCITAAQDDGLLCSNQVSEPFLAAAGEVGHLKLTTPYLNPKLWSPQNPNLYNLEVRLKEQDRIIDSYKVQFGFRTFTVDGSKLLLNGQPFWLRGANPFPNTLRPNDTELARKFTEIAREGNIRVTRSHIVPFTSTWLDAADHVGMAVSFEGTWPWLMLEGEPPDAKLLQAWKDEFISLIRRYRNHPSIILWTVNNEMKFEQINQDNPVMLKKKWLILDDAIRAMRQADPTRPIVADSSYVRKETQKGYLTLVQPEGLDDGDIDDVHRYNGWYNETFFHFFNDEYNDQFSTPGRPLISQEMSTGYPNNDDGHPVRYYLFKHHTPQAFVGDDAYENADPAVFLTRQAFMSKELVETVRRTSHKDSAGLLLFSYFTWFQTPWSMKQIRPGPTYYALKTAMQPVLVSAELYGRHFYEGSTAYRRVCIINDAEDYQMIPQSRLVWEFKSNGHILAQGRTEVPAINYYENLWLNVGFEVPTNLPAPRVDGQLVLRLECKGKILSENNYDVTLATTDWANGEPTERTKMFFWNPDKAATDFSNCVDVTPVNSVATVNLTNILIVGNLKGVDLTPSQVNELRAFVSQGGRVLMLHPGKSLANIFPDQIKNYTAKAGEIVTMHAPESPVFTDIEPLDLAWFERGSRQLPLACTGVYQVASLRQDTLALAFQCDIHTYLKAPADIVKISGTPLVEINFGKGRLLATEMCFESGKNDPVAQRLLMNCLHYLRNEAVASLK
jgi:hypothetical protein